MDLEAELARLHQRVRRLPFASLCLVLRRRDCETGERRGVGHRSRDQVIPRGEVPADEGPVLGEEGLAFRREDEALGVALRGDEHQEIRLHARRRRHPGRLLAAQGRSEKKQRQSQGPQEVLHGVPPFSSAETTAGRAGIDSPPEKRIGARPCRFYGSRASSLRGSRNGAEARMKEKKPWHPTRSGSRTATTPRPPTSSCAGPPGRSISTRRPSGPRSGSGWPARTAASRTRSSPSGIPTS